MALSPFSLQALSHQNLKQIASFKKVVMNYLKMDRMLAHYTD